jgi:hypothetical protein
MAWVLGQGPRGEDGPDGPRWPAEDAGVVLALETLGVHGQRGAVLAREGGGHRAGPQAQESEDRAREVPWAAVPPAGGLEGLRELGEGGRLAGHLHDPASQTSAQGCVGHHVGDVLDADEGQRLSAAAEDQWTPGSSRPGEHGDPGLEERAGPHDGPLGAGGAQVLLRGVLGSEQVEPGVGGTQHGDEDDVGARPGRGVDEVGVPPLVHLPRPGAAPAEEAVHGRDDHRGAVDGVVDVVAPPDVPGHHLDVAAEDGPSRVGVAHQDANPFTRGDQARHHPSAQLAAAAGHEDHGALVARTCAATAPSTFVLSFSSTGSR